MGVDFANRRVLVTGGAGFIGSHLVDALIEARARVTVYDNFSTGFEEFLPQRDRLEVVRGDLLDMPRLSAAMRDVDFVFHMAANADIKDNLKAPRFAIEQNLIATQNVLEAMRAAGVRDIAFASTGSVYGDATVVPTPEDAPFPVQTSIYATSKLAAEGLLSSYAFGYDFRVWVFRFVSVLGPRYTHGHVFDFWRKLRRDPSRLEVLGDGTQRKSYLHVADCVAAMLVATGRAETPINIYNLGQDDWVTVDESIAVITTALAVTPRLEYAGGRRGWVGDSPRVLLDTRRIRALGWAPSRSIQDGVRDTIGFLQANPFVERRV
jgi:UDP-glucose 4-epimerase